MSDFPHPDSYRHPLSDKARQTLEHHGLSHSGLIIRREKGAYIIDIDDNKYIDFSLHQGRVVYGHQPGVLSKIIKNGMSTAMGYAHANKFLPRLLDHLHSLVEFTKSYVYNSEHSMMLSLLQPVYQSRIGVSSSWLARELLRANPLLNVELARGDVDYDVVFLEALDWEKDMSPLDPGKFRADIRIGVVTRSFYRTKPVFGFSLDQVDVLAVGSSVCNGMSSGIILGRESLSVSHETPSLYMTLAILETLKFYRRKGILDVKYPVINARSLSAQQNGIIKCSSAPEKMRALGLMLNPDIQFLCPEHSEHDIRRFVKALEQD